MNDVVLDIANVTRSFIQGAEALHILRGCSLAVSAGERVALIGPSGSGKSTFLQIVGLLERPDTGIIKIAGKNSEQLDDLGRTMLRRQAIGFVYQFHHLLPEFSAAENIVLPQMIAGVSRNDAHKRAMELLTLVGLQQRADHRPARLSGGEQQRVALARALANRPKIVIADEPTGNLDPVTADHVFDVLHHLVETENLALLMATHNHDLAKRMGRVIELRDGVLVDGVVA
jgi:lipoprotein-releasing system ATP-binding protein